MRRLRLGLLIFSCLALAGLAAAAQETSDQWLMMVVTDVTDPARENDFNHWYDAIDIPDVLKVPGYMRARRGVAATAPPTSSAPGQAHKGKYVALYDINSNDMDGTIIDMLLASWHMEKVGRAIDLYQVTERVYYRRHGAAVTGLQPPRSGQNAYLYLVKAQCCGDEAARRRFDVWHQNNYLPALRQVRGLKHAAHYKLHRVVMMEPVNIPPFLGVYEIAAENPAQAAQAIKKATAAALAKARAANLYQETDVTIYRTIADVARP